MLKGIELKTLNCIVDERGYFTEIMRKDWAALLLEDTIAQVNHSFTYPNIVRAWHRHNRGQIDYFIVLKGAIKFGVYDDESGELDEIILNDKQLQIVRIPGCYWHGFKAIGDKPALLVYFTTNLYNPFNPDEERRAWNDPTIIPKTINGKSTDSRVNKSWDWNLSPNK